jgi:uncharacterized protein YcfJ
LEIQMRKARNLLVLVGLLSVTGVALSAPPPWSNSRHNRGYAGDYDYAPVTRVEPIVRQVRIETPRRECYDDVRYVESRGISDPDVGGRTLLGSIIGGVIGHQFGSGSGQDAATVAGAVIGAGVGYDSAKRRYRDGTREEVVRRCDVRYEREYEERIEGYRVSYEYNGREYTTRLPYDPGERIKVRVAVAPAE